MKETSQIDAPNENAALASGKFENFTLHRCHEFELPENLLGVRRSLAAILRIHHELRVSAYHGHWSLEVMHDLRKQSANCSEAFGSLTCGSGSMQTNGCGYIGGEKANKLEVVVAKYRS